jgi:hypothetical protein
MVSENKHIVSSAMLLALRMKYESEIQAARATLMVYLTNSAGIGEHPQHLEEMDKLLASMGSASDKLGMLEKYFNGGDHDELGMHSGPGGSTSEHHYTHGLV